MLSKITKLFRHRHSWRTRRVNKWMIPTVQVCDGCQLERTAVSNKEKPLTYHWEYSDGSKSEDYPLGGGFDG